MDFFSMCCSAPSKSTSFTEHMVHHYIPNKYNDLLRTTIRSNNRRTRSVLKMAAGSRKRVHSRMVGNDVACWPHNSNFHQKTTY